MTTYIALGSNLGNRQRNLDDALDRMAQVAGLRIRRVSQFVETRPRGFESDHLFLNGIAEIDWAGTPEELLKELQQIELALGRPARESLADEVSSRIYRDRVIDLDIVWMDGMELKSPELTIPHPLAGTRDFVLQPLAELNPELARQMQAD